MAGSFGVNLPAQQPGRPIAAATINAGSALASRLARMRAGHGLRQASVDGVPVFELDGSSSILVKTPSGGIPALSGSTPGSAANCAVWIFDGTGLVDSGAVETVFNLGSAAIGGDTFAKAEKIGSSWFAAPTGGGTSTAVITLGKTGGSGIPAKSGTTMGSGNVTLYTRSGAVKTLSATVVTAYNDASSAVSANKDVVLGELSGGSLIVISEDC